MSTSRGKTRPFWYSPVIAYSVSTPRSDRGRDAAGRGDARIEDNLLTTLLPNGSEKLLAVSGQGSFRGAE